MFNSNVKLSEGILSDMWKGLYLCNCYIIHSHKNDIHNSLCQDQNVYLQIEIENYHVDVCQTVTNLAITGKVYCQKEVFTEDSIKTITYYYYYVPSMAWRRF